MSDFEKYLQGDSDLSRSYASLEKVEPDAALDQFILNSAKQAIDDQDEEQRTTKSAWLCWKLDSGFAIAAVIILSASLVILLPKDGQFGDKKIVPSSAPVFIPQSNQLRSEEGENIPATIAEKSIMATDLLDQRQQNETVISSDLKLPAGNRVESESIKITPAGIRSLDSKNESQQANPVEFSVKNEIEESQKRTTRNGLSTEHKTRQRSQKNKVQSKQIESIPPDNSVNSVQDMRSISSPTMQMDSAVERGGSSLLISVEDLINQIKILIKQGKIDEAKVIYKDVKSLIPEQEIASWLSDQEISLLK